MHNEFILPSEKEGFIHRISDIIKRAESLMRKDSSGLHESPSYINAINSLSGSQVTNRCACVCESECVCECARVRE